MIILRISLTLLLLILTACGKESSMIRYVEPDLEQYVVSFEKKARMHIDNVIVKFTDDLGEPNENKYTLGVCHYGTVPYIEIDKEDFYKLGRGQREALIYHELGHCILGYEHYNEELGNTGCPYSVMSAYLVSEKCYYKYYPHYMDDLF